MASTPLLAEIDGLPRPHILQDHPAFLRACHSPWRFIPQNVLVILRGLTLAYLVAAGIMAINYKLGLQTEWSNWRHVFDFAVVSFVLVFVYQLVTFSWTFTHLYHPNLEETEGGLEYYIVSAMSLPSNMGSQRKQFHFTMFYTVTTVFSFMNSAMYWFVSRQFKGGDPTEPIPPQVTGAPGTEDYVTWGWGADTSQLLVPDKPFSDIFGEGWFKSFNLLDIYAITSVIMVVEILIFNSVKKPFAVGTHFLGLLFFAGIYLGWAAIGRVLTGWSAFGWLDREVVGSTEAVTLYSIGFIALAPLMYVLMLGFIAVRDGITQSLDRARATAVAAASHNSLEDS